MHEVPRVVKFIETERTEAATGSEGSGNEELVFNGYGVLILQDEKSSGGDSVSWLKKGKCKGACSGMFHSLQTHRL